MKPVTPRSSPYFTASSGVRKVVTLSSSEYTSRYFVNAKSSVNGSIQSFGPFLQCFLGPGETIDFGKCQRIELRQEQQVQSKLDPSLITNSLPCGYCKQILDGVLNHFSECEKFHKLWDQEAKRPGDISTDQTCCQILEVRIHLCLRHLCQQCCFLRGYECIRVWHRLRQALAHQSGEPVDQKVKGWRCYLAKKSQGSKWEVPKVEFISTDGMRIGSHRLVRHLTDSEYRHTSKKPRIGLFGFSNVRSETEEKPAPWSMPFINGSESPLGLLEELFSQNPWQLLMCTILLNRTTRTQVDVVIYQLFDKWPTPKAILGAAPENIAEVIRPLGIHGKRALAIQRFTRGYLNLTSKREEAQGPSAPFLLTREDVCSFYSCGDYAYGAYRLFVQRNTTNIQTRDHALIAYSEYLRGNLCSRNTREEEKRPLEL